MVHIDIKNPWINMLIDLQYASSSKYKKARNENENAEGNQ